MATRAPRGGTPLAAYVLHRYDWSESSLILDLFTREQGRIAVAAKGAKRPYSQLRAVLLQFQRISLTLGRTAGAEGTAEVQTLRSAEWGGGAAMLTGAALFSGFYLNELLMKLLARHDAHPQLFDAYADTLAALPGSDDMRVEAVLRAFELRLLREIGLLPDLSLSTQTQQPVDPERRYGLRADAGVADEDDDSGGTFGSLRGATLVALQAALEHGSLPALQQICTAALPDLKGVLRAQLHYHLGSSVLRTRQVMIEAQNLDPRGRP